LIRLFATNRKLSGFIKNIFGFRPGNLLLYELAFRHRSVAKEEFNGARVSNERLEYLGDAVLNLIIGDYLFKKFPFRDEGFLTETRSKIVSRNHLNKLSVKLGLDNFIVSNTEFRTAYRSINGDAFEAFIGAIYLDKGYNFTRKVVINRIINTHLDIEDVVATESNYKSRIIEWAQKEKHSVEFKTIEEEPTAQGKLYKVEILIDNQVIAFAQDFSIKGAEKLAAEKAFNQFLNLE